VKGREHKKTHGAFGSVLCACSEAKGRVSAPCPASAAGAANSQSGFGAGMGFGGRGETVFAKHRVMRFCHWSASNRVSIHAVLCVCCLWDPAGIGLLFWKGKGLISVIINH